MVNARTIQETVEAGITTLSELQAALYIAIQLEFSTLPPYLCAQWSIKNDPSGVSAMIGGVAVQEMLHFGLACNMYTATGGSLKGLIANPDFVPVYPTRLPGGVHPALIVHLLPFGPEALRQFMAIEYPENQPLIQPPASPEPPPARTGESIGAFYQTIAAGFQTVFPDALPGPIQNQVATAVGSDELFPINSIYDVPNAITEITDQGEGASTAPVEVPELAHYYTFAQVYYGKQVKATYEYAGAPITMPEVYPFAPQKEGAADQNNFITTFTTMLTQLEAAWTSGASIQTAIGTMFNLQSAGVSLIQQGFTPQFTYKP